MVAQLNLSLYGTRDAAFNWTKTYTKFMLECGFEVGKGSPCNFVHRGRGIALTVHGDDFISCGSTTDLAWLQKCFEKRFEVTTTVLGPEKGQGLEVRLGNCNPRTGPRRGPNQRSQHSRNKGGNCGIQCSGGRHLRGVGGRVRAYGGVRGFTLPRHCGKDKLVGPRSHRYPIRLQRSKQADGEAQDMRLASTETHWPLSERSPKIRPNVCVAGLARSRRHVYGL